MQVTVLASGSDGNATLFESGGTRVLVDAGLGPRSLQIATEGRLPHAVVVTHAHQDHVGHAERLGRGLGIPVYVTPSVERDVPMRKTVEVRRYSPRGTFGIGALTITATPLPHDAAQVALVVSDGARSAAIVTDLGEIPGSLHDAIRGCNVLLIESNYDAGLLERGPYPFYLKRRVSSARGHLSNDQVHGLLRRLSPRTHTVMLMHLSTTNNCPELATAVARDALGSRKVRRLVAPPRRSVRIDCDDVRAERRRAQQLALAF